MRAVILAGGKGTRLRPYTLVWPKPLMPLGKYLILDVVLKQLKHYGFNEIFLAVGHLSEIFERYLGSEKYGLKIHYSLETEPLGTAGPLSLIEDIFGEHFLVMNGDVLTAMNYGEFVEFHKASGGVSTIATYRRPVYLPYGCIEANQSQQITGYREKPTLEYLVSMGVYMFSPQIQPFIEKGKRLDFPELINILIQKQQRVVSYKTSAYWLDIGRREDYNMAVKQFEEQIENFLPGEKR